MEQKEKDEVLNDLAGDSLDAPATTTSTGSQLPDDAPAPTPVPAPHKPDIGTKIRNLITHVNIYLIIFAFIVVFVSGLTYVSYLQQKGADSAPSTPTQDLDPESLKQLKNNDASVGSPKQTLTVQSNAIFAGKVLVRDDMDIAGTLNIGGTLNISGLIVSGNSVMDQIQGNKLSINGDANFQGQLTVQKGITISGGASFGAGITAPVLTVDSLQLTGDLQISRHIDAGGPTPSGTMGGALGSGGTASVSGTDTAGTIAVNTGGGPLPGCFLTITFSRSFNSQPHITVTPVGSAAGSLNYYINRTANGFSMCTVNAAAPNSNFAFDYIVID